MKNVELKKMSLTNIENRLTPAEMENVMAGSGGAFGWGSSYTLGCYGGTMIYWSDYNIFGIAFSTKQVASISC